MKFVEFLREKQVDKNRNKWYNKRWITGNGNRILSYYACTRLYSIAQTVGYLPEYGGENRHVKAVGGDQNA